MSLIARSASRNRLSSFPKRPADKPEQVDPLALADLPSKVSSEVEDEIKKIHDLMEEHAIEKESSVYVGDMCHDVEKDSRYVLGLSYAKSSLTVPLRLNLRVILILLSR